MTTATCRELSGRKGTGRPSSSDVMSGIGFPGCGRFLLGGVPLQLEKQNGGKRAPNNLLALTQRIRLTQECWHENNPRQGSEHTNGYSD